MSLEHALLNRLEARSVQLAQLKQEIHGLKLLVDEKMTINENLAAEVTRERETARANYEHMERQIAGLHGECEQLRREVPLESTREALRKATAKLQEVTTRADNLSEQITSARLEREQMQHQISELRTECDRIREISKSLVPKSALKQAVQEAAELHAEVVKLRAEVPLESTREGLKNATAKIAELKNDVRRCYELADEIGRGEGESIVDLITRQAERITGLIAKLQEVTTDRDRVLNELAAILAEANKSGRCGGDPVALIKQGQTDLDALTHFERDNARLDALVSKLQGELDKQKTQADSMERQVGGLTRTRLRLEFERDKMKAKLEPLEALYKTLKGYQDSDSILGHGTIIEVAIDKATEALSQLTA